MLEVFEVTDVDVAFSNKDNAPKEKDIPKEFFKSNNYWNKFVSMWFFKGLSNDNALHPRKEVNPEKALIAVRSIIGSYGLEHDYKIAACAYLMSQWFNQPEEEAK